MNTSALIIILMFLIGVILMLYGHLTKYKDIASPIGFIIIIIAVVLGFSYKVFRMAYG